MLGIWNRELGMFKGIELRVWRSGAGVLAMLGACGLAYAEQPKQSPSPAREAQVRRDYGQLPMSFEANRGQSAEPVRFLARGDGYDRERGSSHASNTGEQRCACTSSSIWCLLPAVRVSVWRIGSNDERNTSSF